MTQKVYDALIVGAGPGGSAAAITLAKHGHSVLLIDKDKFPRSKICGDGLTGNSARLLKKLGVWNEVEQLANRTSKVEVFNDDKRLLTLNLGVHTLKRKVLDKILLDKAISLGAEFRNLNFTGSIEDQSDFTICKTEDSNSKEINIKAKLILLATGCQAPDMLKKIGDIRSKVSDTIAVRGYYRADWKINNCLIFHKDKYKNGGYLWVFPVGNNEYNIGCGTLAYQKADLKKELYKFVEEFSKSRNTPGQWVSPVKGAFLRTNLSNLKYASYNRVLLAGEALGSTFQASGEGIGMAIDTGILAAEVTHEALVKNNVSILKRYKTRIKKELKIKYLPYQILFFIFKWHLMNKLFKFRIINEAFLSVMIRGVRICSSISLKLRENK